VTRHDQPNRQEEQLGDFLDGRPKRVAEDPLEGDPADLDGTNDSTQTSFGKDNACG
jgi:hypothetical protein